jgi:capsule polysaccharide export protein KpsE/RkpR
MTQTAINGELKRINDKIKHLETVMVTTAKTGSLGMLERSRQIRKEILREFSIIQEERDNAIAVLKDNLKDHLAPYKNEDIQKIREEKMQLVTAAEFTQVHKEKLEAERKLATAVGALEKSRERLGDFQEPWNDREKEVDLILSEALAEIGEKQDD